MALSNLPNCECVRLSLEGPTLVITIDRPEAMNALNQTVFKSLDAILDWLEKELEKNFEIRAVIVTGSGEKAFVAGADIKQFVEMGVDGAKALAISGQATFKRFEELPVPVIAAVNGFALGGGFELALACDLMIAADTAKFGLPECTLGLMPGYAGTVRLPRRIGPARAREMAFTGNMIAAPEALILGLVSKIVPREELMKTALEMAKVFANRAPLSLKLIKRSIHEGMNLTADEAMELEAELFGELFGTADKAEGVSAFIEKRKASFQGH